MKGNCFIVVYFVISIKGNYWNIYLFWIDFEYLLSCL